MVNEENWDYEPKMVKDLKKGEWFTIKPIAYPLDRQVYIRDEYDRSSRKFACGRCDDISYFREFKGDRIVYTGFIY